MVFSAGLGLKQISKESAEFQSWCEGGGGGGRAPHPGEEAGASGWRTRDLPSQLLDWLIPPGWVLLSLRKLFPPQFLGKFLVRPFQNCFSVLVIINDLRGP